MDESEPLGENLQNSTETSVPALCGEWSWWTRIGLFWAGVVVPIQCLACGLMDMSSINSRWQSGKIRDYADLLLSRPTIPFWPLLVYSMVCHVLLIIDFNRWSARFAVRGGIYFGVVLATQYFLIVGVVLNGSPIENMEGWAGYIFFAAIAALVPILVLGGLAMTPVPINIWVSICIGVPLFALGLVPPVLIIVLLCGAAWTTAAYGLMARWLLYRRRSASSQFDLKQLFGICSWFAAYCGAWRASYAWMLAEYANLPETAPGCYIATAAAGGHRWFVASQPVRTETGQTLLVNDQLRYFKAAELALLCASPRVHRAVRRVYDCVGMRLARLLKHPWLADAAYLGLKPAEWIVRLLLPRSMRETVRSFWRY